MTAQQKAVLYPALQRALIGWERSIIDFGCGTGRFTGDLADIVEGRAVGVDPVASLLELAPAHRAVDYRHMTPNQIPAETSSLDVAWVCLVLGGIVDEVSLRRTASELERVLRRDGLLFLTENIADQPDTATWAFRTVADYVDLFPSVTLAQVGEYVDLGERIAMMAGRRA